MDDKKRTGGLYDIPANLIMGFLGAGKTTAILHLLDAKPVREFWAVLVNEFGAVGIDGAVITARGVFVKEVPGGCMCCAAGVPMQVAVNRLLREARPDRLLIEASGLGHPRRVLETLDSEHFRGVLDIRASLCLVDPRKLGDPRCLGHENFLDQIHMADVLIANKVDLADAQALQRFGHWAGGSEPAKEVVAHTVQGRVDLSWLDLPRNQGRTARFPHRHRPLSPERKVSDSPAGAIVGANREDEYQSRGWVFAPDGVFDHGRLYRWIVSQAPPRLKGVVLTDRGWFLFNFSDGLLTVTAIEPAQDSRIEILLARRGDWSGVEEGLEGCLIG